jgi:hypothetical protein
MTPAEKMKTMRLVLKMQAQGVSDAAKLPEGPTFTARQIDLASQSYKRKAG